MTQSGLRPLYKITLPDLVGTEETHQTGVCECPRFLVFEY